MERPWIKSFDDTVHGYSSTFQVDPSDDFPTIYKVPDCISSYDPKAYGPVIVSLGPYHHEYARDYADCSPPLIDKLKFYYLKKFLKRSPNYSFADYIQMIKDREMEVRNAYSEPVMMSSDYFVRMMLLDCCFVLEVITSIRFVIEAEGTDMEVNDHDIEAELLVNPIISTPASRHQLMIDMLILESQLPMFLLEHLYAFVRHDIHYQGRKISSLVLLILNAMTPLSWSLNIHFAGEVYHFLHLFHSSITSVPSKLKNNGSTTSCNHYAPDSYLLRCVPTAMQLQDAGVSFERDKDVEKNFLCITFESGRMKIPPLEVDEYTNTLFRNLIAFEQCYSKHVKTSKQLRHMGVEDQYFTMYASLMDCIINVDADVSLLQRKQIIISWLGNGEEVARLFNNLAKGTTVCVERGYLSTVCRSLNKHCNTDCNRWKAKLNHDYLNSPWAGI